MATDNMMNGMSPHGPPPAYESNNPQAPYYQLTSHQPPGFVHGPSPHAFYPPPGHMYASPYMMPPQMPTTQQPIVIMQQQQQQQAPMLITVPQRTSHACCCLICLFTGGLSIPCWICRCFDCID